MMNELNPIFRARAAELVSAGRFFFERGRVANFTDSDLASRFPRFGEQG